MLLVFDHIKHMNKPLTHRPRKRFGQNFLHDPGVIQRIIQVINPQAGQQLVEIGPGQGAITLPLLKGCHRLHVVELDRDLIEPLRALCADAGELLIHNADALRTDFCDFADGEPLRVVGNLPYNISTPLLFHFLDQARCITDMHFMLQKEVVDRIVAVPGSKTYGRLSVAVQARCHAQSLFTIGPGAFNPPPKVDSAILRITPDEDAIGRIRDPALLNRVLMRQQTAHLQGRLRAMQEHTGLVDLERHRLPRGVHPPDRSPQGASRGVRQRHVPAPSASARGGMPIPVRCAG